MKKTCLIIQSGAMGDIFIVAPIAYYYAKKGYIVFWPVRGKYYNLVTQYFPYVYAQKIDEDYIKRHYTEFTGDWLKDDAIYLNKMASNVYYDIVLDLSDRGKVSNEKPGETFEQTKYRLAKVPYELKHHLKWRRNQDIEIVLYERFIQTKPYILAHLTSSHGDKAGIPRDFGMDVIEIQELPGFEIPDYYYMAIHSKEIWCVESAVHQFFDSIVHELMKNGVKLYLLSRPSLKPGESYTLSEYWDKSYMK
jgi:hypothetical protein